MEVKINNINYNILQVEPNSFYLEKETGGFYWASCIFDSSIIVIRNDLDNDRTKRLLIHELTHAVLDAYGFSAHDNQYIEEEIAEIMASFGEQIIDITKTYMEECRKEMKKPSQYNTIGTAMANQGFIAPSPNTGI